MMTVTFNDALAANFALLAVRNRIDEINRYHRTHPDLPRQDDVLSTYMQAERDLVRDGAEL